MTRKRNPYKTYTKEFKAEAVRWMQASDRPASEIATQLGTRKPTVPMERAARCQRRLSTSFPVAVVAVATAGGATPDRPTMRQENQALWA